MTSQQRDSVTKEFFSSCLEEAARKQKDYASPEDALINFKRIAERTGMSKYQVFSVYFNKHIDSINTAIALHPHSPVCNTETLHSRMVDAVNYLSLAYCMLYEDGLIPPAST